MTYLLTPMREITAPQGNVSERVVWYAEWIKILASTSGGTDREKENVTHFPYADITSIGCYLWSEPLSARRQS